MQFCQPYKINPARHVAPKGRAPTPVRTGSGKGGPTGAFQPGFRHARSQGRCCGTGKAGIAGAPIPPHPRAYGDLRAGRNRRSPYARGCGCPDSLCRFQSSPEPGMCMCMCMYLTRQKRPDKATGNHGRQARAVLSKKPRRDTRPAMILRVSGRIGRRSPRMASLNVP